MNRSTLKTSALLLVVGSFLATQPGAGCVDTTTTQDGKTTTHRQVDGDLNSDDSKNDDPNYIPRRAAIVKEGRGPLEFVADADGDFYVQDLKEETTVIAHRVHRGEKISVLPDDNRVRLDDDSVYKGDLKKDHVHRIYLLRDRRFDDDRNRDDHHDRRDDDRSDRTDLRDDGDLTPITINKKDRGPYKEVGVPKDARMMDQGMNREMTFVTSVSGRVYVFDVKHDCVVATPEIGARQVFKFSPGIDRIMIDDKKVGRYDFDPDSQYRIYFAR